MTQCLLNEAERAEILLAAGCGVGELSGVQAAHVRLCGSCSEACARQAALWKTLGDWTLPEISSNFNRDLYAKIDLLSQQSWVDRIASRMRTWLAQPALAVATVALVLTAGFVFDHSAGKAHLPAVVVSTTEAEQVEKTLEDMEMLRLFDVNADDKEAAKSL